MPIPSRRLGTLRTAALTIRRVYLSHVHTLQSKHNAAPLMVPPAATAGRWLCQLCPLGRRLDFRRQHIHRVNQRILRLTRPNFGHDLACITANVAKGVGGKAHSIPRLNWMASGNPGPTPATHACSF
eukprot:359913-Chlamydomonas_euryale.AAC.14